MTTKQVPTVTTDDPHPAGASMAKPDG